MSTRDTIYREDAIKALTIAVDEHTDIFEAVERIPSAELYIEFAEWVKLWFKDEPSNPHDITYINALENRIKELEADRTEGEWIYCEDYVGHDGYECSNCGFFIPWTYDCYADSNFILNYHTCPHCDARMKGAGGE